MNRAMPATEDTLELALAELLRRTEVGGPDGQPPTHVLDSLIAAYPQFESDLREFWQLHCHFVMAGEHAHASATDRKPRPAPPQVQRVELSSSDLVGRTLGPYELVEEIDRGGMGVVFKARHTLLERTVALKVIRSGELAGPGELKRFRGEAEAAARLSHPCIVPIYEVGEVGGLVYFTMPFIEGQTLLARTSDRPLSVEEAVRLVHRLCLAIQYAHNEGILHRDLKPGNVLIDANMNPIIIDFGLAKFAQRESDLTTTGQILGTPAYMAPNKHPVEAIKPIKQRMCIRWVPSCTSCSAGNRPLMVRLRSTSCCKCSIANRRLHRNSIAKSRGMWITCAVEPWQKSLASDTRAPLHGS